jgi:hypothetical protein
MFFKQSERFDTWRNKVNEYFAEWHDAAGAVDDGIINKRDKRRYDEWEKMHDGVIWYDTAACLQGSYIGKINAMSFKPKDIKRPTTQDSLGNPRDNQFYGQWWTKEYAPDAYTFYNNQTVVYQLKDETKRDGDDHWKGTSKTPSPDTEWDNERTYTYRKNAWDNQISMTGSWGYNDKSLYRDYLEVWLDAIEDCDLDCQAKGSNLTLIAGLMSTAFGIHTICALLIFTGAWRGGFRAASVYCSFFACVVNFAIIIVVAVLLFTKYNLMCAHSMVNTFEGFNWTMADDMQATFTSWITSIFTMFGFLCCGLCSTYRCEK